jgi:hypothetical protein
MLREMYMALADVPWYPFAVADNPKTNPFAMARTKDILNIIPPLLICLQKKYNLALISKQSHGLHAGHGFVLRSMNKITNYCKINFTNIVFFLIQKSEAG